MLLTHQVADKNRSYQKDSTFYDADLEEMYEDELRGRGINTYPNTQDDILQYRHLYNTTCRRMAKCVHTLYKEPRQRHIKFPLLTRRPHRMDSGGTPNFRLQRAVATTEKANSSDGSILLQDPP